MNIDDQLRQINAEWEKAKTQSQGLLVVLGKLCELNREVVSLLRKQGIPYSEAAATIETDIEKYRNLLTQSRDDLLEIEDEYKKLVASKKAIGGNAV